MKTEIRELQGFQLTTASATSSVILLPVNYNNKEIDHQYHSNTISFYKYANEKLSFTYLSEPLELFEQRSGEWFAPIFLITKQLIKDNPIITAVLCGIISNYITDIFKGQPKPDLNVRIIYEKNENSKYIEFHYSGNFEGLETFEGSIAKALENDRK